MSEKTASRTVCDGCGVGIVWRGTEWVHAQPSRCSEFEQPSENAASHDDHCEAEFISGPNTYSPCACTERAE